MSPLNWGIGHAARLVPIAHQLYAQGASIFICAHGPALNLMRLECPYAQFVEDAPFEITYAKGKWRNIFKLLWQLPSMALQVYKEQQLLKKLVVKHQIEAIISDNRYGFYHASIPCLFITHQLQIKVPIGAGLVNLVNHYFINKFNACWVPDWAQNEHALAGALSRNKGLKKLHYIGPLSRATKIDSNTKEDAPILYLLSGVEPQRTLLEHIILQRWEQHPHKAILVRGSALNNEKLNQLNEIEVHNFCDAKQLQTIVAKCKLIVARSGYSTIMDVVQWQKNAIFIPTPGQFEQAYLAKYLSGKKWFYTINQDDFLQLNETAIKTYQFPKQPQNQTNFAALLKLIM